MPQSDVPDVIAAYQQAHDRRDTEAALAAFGPDATVIDDGTTYTGAERIGWWLSNTASEYTYHAHLRVRRTSATVPTSSTTTCPATSPAARPTCATGSSSTTA